MDKYLVRIEDEDGEITARRGDTIGMAITVTLEAVLDHHCLLSLADAVEYAETRFMNPFTDDEWHERTDLTAEERADMEAGKVFVAAAKALIEVLRGS